MDGNEDILVTLDISNNAIGLDQMSGITVEFNCRWNK